MERGFHSGSFTHVFWEPVIISHTLSLVPACKPRYDRQTIFILCARKYQYQDRDKDCWTRCDSPNVPSWVNISYVCRHWRNVALNCPTLWSYISATSPRWTEEFLARSEQSLLKFSQSARNNSLLEQVMNHVERMQELHLEMWDDYFLRKLSSRAPCLQILEIFEGSVSLAAWMGSLPFDGDTPALRTLCLPFCSVPWYSFKLGGLTTLDLRCISAPFQQNTVEFLATLSRMQDLTHLYLDRALASATGFLPSPAFQTFQKIDLPHLSLVCLVAPLSTVIAFLSCVTIPLETELKLKCCSEHDSSVDDYASLSSLLAQRFGVSEDQAVPSPTIRSLVIQQDGPYWGELKLTVSVLEHERDTHFPMPYLFRDCNILLEIAVFPDRLLAIVEKDDRDVCMLLTNVQRVYAIGLPHSSDIWSKILGRLPELKHLHLICSDMSDLASILSVAPHAGSTENKGGYADRGPDRILAPVLEELELHRIQFASAADVQSLYDALSTRKGSRGQLRMTQCLVGDYCSATEVDMVGRWEGGHFHVQDK
ncbi:hypothetical protein HD554DRAFT_2325100 [Boletus coccyginus]|nr:hypothetical protein HD554DRAFT_2325100 [Boletus coccyginus]